MPPLASSLRDYQFEIKSRLFDQWKLHQSVMVQMPTGTGKTHLLASVVKDFVSEEGASSGMVWIVAHRRELVAQIEETIAKYGIRKEDNLVKALSIQWLTRHWEEMEHPPRLIVIDEAHHALANTYTELWKRYPQAKKLGMTATPCRLNKRGFTDLFDTLVTSWSIAEFIEKEQLSVFDYVSIRPDSEAQRLVDRLSKRSADGDFQVKEMDELLNKRPSIEQLCQSVRRYAPGKKGIVYAISIDHARRIAAYYCQQGVDAVAIDSKTPAAERKRLVEEFKEGKVKVLVNVDVFSEGFDCPDVEFVQMARPTLSLSKYLQQVGRGLRKAVGKTTCVLIDNVGLYRAFGLPIRPWDWEAMFQGLAAGKGMTAAQAANPRTLPAIRVEQPEQDGEMELVMPHDRLLAAIEEQRHAPALSAGQPGLKAYHDKETGLWGLRCGGRSVTEAKFITLFGIRYNLAAVRFGDNSCGVVNGSGETLWKKDRYRSMSFTRNYMLAAQTDKNKTCYIDLHNFYRYEKEPVLKKYGKIELLQVGKTYYSRTKTRYISHPVINKNFISHRGFYLTLFDVNVPPSCNRQESFCPAACGNSYGYACLLEGDNESFYWLYQWMPDGSIVVMDPDGQYYHVEEGKEKACIGCNISAEGKEDPQAAIQQLERQIEEKCQRQRKEKEKKRQLYLNGLTSITPFRMGMKWGLKSGERILVPPVYRSVRPPVGNYCAVEMNYSQWGIITLDGTVVVEPKYAEVVIGDNGTAQLTFVTGKKISVKLR